MKRDIVISLFDKTGESLKPWRDAEYQCFTFDNQHPLYDGKYHIAGGIWKINIDLLKASPIDILSEIAQVVHGNNWDLDDVRKIGERVAFISCYPPCDSLAVSGARWFKGKGLRSLADSVHMFATAADFCEFFQTDGEYPPVPYYIENPVSTISTYWRKPDFSYHPWQYSGLEPADCYTKKTCLWTGGGFNMPAADCDSDCQPDDRIHKAAPGPDRKNFRSATPAGFARAVFLANTPISDRLRYRFKSIKTESLT